MKCVGTLKMIDLVYPGNTSLDRLVYILNRAIVRIAQIDTAMKHN